MTSFSLRYLSVRRRHAGPRPTLSDLRLSAYMLLAALILTFVFVIVDMGLRV